MWFIELGDRIIKLEGTQSHKNILTQIGSYTNLNSGVSGSVKQSVRQNAIIFSDFEHGEVSELADEHDLGSCAERHGGSSPPFPT